MIGHIITTYTPEKSEKLFKQLLEAIEKNDLKGFAQVIQKENPYSIINLILNYKTKRNNNTVLMKAAKCGRFEIIKYLLEKTLGVYGLHASMQKPFLDARNKKGLTAADIAIKAKRNDIYAFLQNYRNITLVEMQKQHEENANRRTEEIRQERERAQQARELTQELAKRDQQRQETLRNQYLEEREQQRLEESEQLLVASLREQQTRQQTEERGRPISLANQGNSSIANQGRSSDVNSSHEGVSDESQSSLTRAADEYNRIVKESGIKPQNNSIAASTIPAPPASASPAAPASVKPFQDPLGTPKGEIPDYALCIFTDDVMKDPVTMTTTGHTYCRKQLEKYFAFHKNPEKLPCPVNGSDIYLKEVQNNKTNVLIKKLITAYLESIKEEKQETQPSQTFFAKQNTISTTPTTQNSTRDKDYGNR